jgi:hypothetical protein
LTPEEANAYRRVSNISKSVNFPETTQKSLEKVREMDEEIEGFEVRLAFLFLFFVATSDRTCS